MCALFDKVANLELIKFPFLIVVELLS